MKAKWTQIVVIWALALVVTVLVVIYFKREDQWVQASFGSILAGSIATVSLLQLFGKNKSEGFVRKLIYVGGGTYLILAAATAYLFLRG